MIDPKSAGNDPAPAPKKTSGGHRAVDVKDAVAEMTERAKEISQEAGTTMAAAMKELIAAAAGLAGFAIESARDLVQFMVRRGQMTQEEADKLLREVEAAHPKKKVASAPATKSPSPSATKTAAPAASTTKSAKPTPPAKKTVEKAAKPTAKVAAKKAPPKKNNSTAKAKKAPAAKK